MGKGALSRYLYVTLSRISFGGAILERNKLFVKSLLSWVRICVCVYLHVLLMDYR
jgi:hypothetical protein